MAQHLGLVVARISTFIDVLLLQVIHQVWVILELLTNGSAEVSFARANLTLDNHVERGGRPFVVSVSHKEVLDVPVDLVHLADSINILPVVLVLCMLHRPFDDQWVVRPFEVCLRRNHPLGNFKLILWIDWSEDRNSYGLAFEFTMTSVVKRDVVEGFVFGTLARIYLPLLTVHFWPSHDSSRQIDNVTEA